jgi:AraC family transcriptional regulator
MRNPHFRLPASNKIHFFGPGSPTKGGDMDLFDRFVGNDSWHTRRLLEYAGTLTEEQLDRPLPTVVELLPWRESNKTLRQLLENIIFIKEVWTTALSGAEMDINGSPESQPPRKRCWKGLKRRMLNCIVFSVTSASSSQNAMKETLLIRKSR